jgi:EmrB/QacA subfamily drug resistance transporter
VDRKWWTLIAVCFGTFMLLLDITVVNVALPDIQIALHSTFQDLQWVVDAYALTLAAFLLTAGVLGDMYGRRGMFAIGLVLFSLSSLTCGLATTPLMLNLSRAAQGVGGAIMFATSLALIAQAFAGKQRGTAIGIYGAVIGGAVAVGPLVGGAITTGIGWRWIFFLNIPIGVVAVIITLTKVDNAKIQTGRRIDWLGFVTFTSSLFLLVYALVQGNDKGWGSTYIVSMLVASVLLMAIFIVGEWKQRDPMLDLTLFKRPAMVGVSLGSFTLSASIFAMFLYLTLYLQEVLGYSALAAGLRFLPLSMLAFIVAPIAGKLTVRVQTRFLMSLGLLLVAVGCHLMTDVAGNSSWTVLLPGFLVCGLGVGLTNPVLASGAVSVVPPERSGMSSGAASTFRQVGIATGIAGLGAIFVHQITPAVIANLQGSAAGQSVLRHGGQSLGTALASGGVRQVATSIPTPAGRQALVSAYQDGFASTFNHLMGIAAVIAAIGAVGCLFLVRQKDFVPSIAAGEWSGPKTAEGDDTGPTAGATHEGAPDVGGVGAGGDDGPTPASPARTG